MTIMILSAIWYNLVIQYYYIIHLNAQIPPAITDKYFAVVYYVTTLFNELNFCLLLGMALVILTFASGRLRRTSYIS